MFFPIAHFFKKRIFVQSCISNYLHSTFLTEFRLRVLGQMLSKTQVFVQMCIYQLNEIVEYKAPM